MLGTKPGNVNLVSEIHVVEVERTPENGSDFI